VSYYDRNGRPLPNYPESGAQDADQTAGDLPAVGMPASGVSAAGPPAAGPPTDDQPRRRIADAFGDADPLTAPMPESRRDRPSFGGQRSPSVAAPGRLGGGDQDFDGTQEGTRAMPVHRDLAGDPAGPGDPRGPGGAQTTAVPRLPRRPVPPEPFGPQPPYPGAAASPPPDAPPSGSSVGPSAGSSVGTSVGSSSAPRAQYPTGPGPLGGSPLGQSPLGQPAAGPLSGTGALGPFGGDDYREYGAHYDSGTGGDELGRAAHADRSRRSTGAVAAVVIGLLVVGLPALLVMVRATLDRDVGGMVAAGLLVVGLSLLAAGLLGSLASAGGGADPDADGTAGGPWRLLARPPLLLVVCGLVTLVAAGLGAH
jgi:hypothetical protein